MTRVIHLFIGIGLLTIVWGKVPCDSTSFCQRTLRPGSSCQAGFCTNPFARGCLHEIEGADSRPMLRVCNSEDDPDAEERGLCTSASSYFDYPEIRISPGDWESSMFTTWIMQIMLSEVLNVPTTVNVGRNRSLNFYDIENSFDYAEVAHDWQAIEEANLHECDCRLSSNDCANVLPEVWQEPTIGGVDGHLNGLISYNGFYMPKYTVAEYPSLASHWGLRGEANREKLASIFKRPTTWLQYCDEVSETKCNQTDSIASRRPVGRDEEDKYFAGEGLYIGHFRATDENNCTLNPSTCSGFLFGYPCHWTSQRHKQLFWNEIRVNWTASFTYDDLSQIFQAANATRSHIFIEWWYPEPRIENYQRIQLPGATGQCVDNRIERGTCILNETELKGSPEEACDYYPKAVERFYNSKLNLMTMKTNVAHRSPAYEFIRKLQLTDFDIRALLNGWIGLDFDRYNYDPREAVCSWVHSNLVNGSNLMQYIPEGYPREIASNGSRATFKIWSSLNICLASVISLGILMTGLATYHNRKTPVMRCAQPHFLYLFCLGYFLVPIGSFFYVVRPTNRSCMARHWFVLSGYTLGRVPLLVKVAAINKMAMDTRRYQRREMSQTRLFIIVSLLLVITTLFLSIWSIYDPSVVQEELILQKADTHLVDVYIFCSSSSDIWPLISYCWQTLYILGAAILAHQSRHVLQDFNESKDLVRMAYVSSMFIVFRLMVTFSTNKMMAAELHDELTGLFLTLDAFLNIFVYFGPKFLLIYEREVESQSPIQGKSNESGSGSSKESWLSRVERNLDINLPVPNWDDSDKFRPSSLSPK